MEQDRFWSLKLLWIFADENYVATTATDGKAMSGFEDPETYRTILESLQTGICVVDLRRKLLLWSDGAEQITGYLRHEVVGHECADNLLPHCNQAGCEMCGDHCPLKAATREFNPVESLGFLHHKPDTGLRYTCGALPHGMPAAPSSE
jgi:PAS domain-containing protein